MNSATFLENKNIVVMGDKKFFHEIRGHLARHNRVYCCTPKTLLNLVRRLAEADVVWIEWGTKWCDLVGRLAPPCHVVCRIHRYEVFLPRRIEQHRWNVFDHVFLVSRHMEECFLAALPEANRPKGTSVLYNGIDLSHFALQVRAPGFNLCAIAAVVYRKNFHMMLEIMEKLVKQDDRYTLRIIGPVVEGDCLDAFQAACRMSGLEQHVRYEGSVPHEDVTAWLSDMNFILSTSLHEGHPVGLNEGMACGIKPIIYAYPGAQEVFPDRLLFRTSEQAVEMILDDDYDSRSYRQWVESRFSDADQHRQVDNTLAACVDTGTGRTRISFLARAIALLGRRTVDRLGRVLFTTLDEG